MKLFIALAILAFLTIVPNIFDEYTTGILSAIFLFSIILIPSIKNFRNNRKNNKSPEIIIDAVIVAKTIHKISKITDYYYITFELNSKERLQFKVNKYDYGLFIEGDRGKLTYQGTRFHSFERIID